MPPTPAATADEVVRIVRESDRRVLATTEVAEELEVSDPTARKYLKQARDDGRLGQETLPGDIAVWYVDERQSHVGEFLDGEAEIERSPGAERGKHKNGPKTDGGNPATSDELAEAVAGLREDLIARIEDIEEAANRREEGSEPYAGVASASRRRAIKEQRLTKGVAIISALGLAGGLVPLLGILLFVDGSVTVPVIGVGPGVALSYVLALLMVSFVIAILVYGVLSVLLRIGAFEWADRTLPFRPNPTDETPESHDARR